MQLDKAEKQNIGHSRGNKNSKYNGTSNAMWIPCRKKNVRRTANQWQKTAQKNEKEVNNWYSMTYVYQCKMGCVEWNPTKLISKIPLHSQSCVCRFCFYFLLIFIFFSIQLPSLSHLHSAFFIYNSIHIWICIMSMRIVELEKHK